MQQHIYVVDSGSLRKIGITSNIKKRIRSLELSGGFECSSIFYSTMIEDARDIERIAHSALSKDRALGEWFSCSFSVCVECVKSILMSKEDCFDYLVLNSDSLTPSSMSKDKEVAASMYFNGREPKGKRISSGLSGIPCISKSSSRSKPWRARFGGCGKTPTMSEKTFTTISDCASWLIEMETKAGVRK